MAIVIDLNVIAMVFDSGNASHVEFAPIKEWIDRGEGFLLFGGTKYIAELRASLRSLRLVRQLKDGGKAVEILSDVVDTLQRQVERKTAGKRCNDQHLIGLLAAAHCSLLCSLDRKSYPFIKDRSLYPNGCPKVRIYCSSRNTDLLVRCRRDDIRNARP